MVLPAPIRMAAFAFMHEESHSSIPYRKRASKLKLLFRAAIFGMDLISYKKEADTRKCIRFFVL
jgi:hypothetical protein